MTVGEIIEQLKRFPNKTNVYAIFGSEDQKCNHINNLYIVDSLSNEDDNGRAIIIETKKS